MTPELFSHLREEIADPQKYMQLQQHIQRRILAIQQGIKDGNAQSNQLMELLKGYIAFKNVCIETRRHNEENSNLK
jgi:hypothetical protein